MLVPALPPESMCRQPKFIIKTHYQGVWIPVLFCDPGGKSLPLWEPTLNFSASRVLSSRDRFVTEGEFSKYIPEKTKLCTWSLRLSRKLLLAVS